jgi:hypothetical protein
MHDGDDGLEIFQNSDRMRFVGHSNEVRSSKQVDIRQDFCPAASNGGAIVPCQSLVE